MLDWEKLIRGGGQLVSNGDIQYKCVFVGKNLYVFRVVDEGLGFRGEKYLAKGFVLAWSCCEEYQSEMPPSFVPLTHDYR